MKPLKTVLRFVLPTLFILSRFASANDFQKKIETLLSPGISKDQAWRVAESLEKQQLSEKDQYQLSEIMMNQKLALHTREAALYLLSQIPSPYEIVQKKMVRYYLSANKKTSEVVESLKNLAAIGKLSESIETELATLASESEFTLIAERSILALSAIAKQKPIHSVAQSILEKNLGHKSKDRASGLLEILFSSARTSGDQEKYIFYMGELVKTEYAFWIYFYLEENPSSDPAVIEIITRGLTNPNSSTQAAAFSALGKVKKLDDTNLNKILELMKSGSESTRALAAIWAAKYSSNLAHVEDAVVTANKLLESSRSIIRNQAVRALSAAVQNQISNHFQSFFPIRTYRQLFSIAKTESKLLDEESIKRSIDLRISAVQGLTKIAKILVEQTRNQSAFSNLNFSAAAKRSYYLQIYNMFLSQHKTIGKNRLRGELLKGLNDIKNELLKNSECEKTLTFEIVPNIQEIENRNRNKNLN